MKVEYGIAGSYIDITEQCAVKDGIFIPRTDNTRIILFGDHCHGIQKQIVLTDDFEKTQELDVTQSVILKPLDGKFSIDFMTFIVDAAEERRYVRCINTMTTSLFLQYLHSTLQLENASFAQEYAEQEMVVQYLPEDATVLELGGNYGRNSCIIAALLKSSENLVVFESSEEFAHVLKRNRDINGFKFAVEAKALSKQPLMQSGWSTFAAPDVLPTGFARVATMSWSDVKEKYHWLSFDTLVADCEGALYSILRDEPDLLHGFKRVCIENDFNDDAYKAYVDTKFVEAGLVRVYSKALLGYDQSFTSAIRSSFYEVWELSATPK